MIVHVDYSTTIMVHIDDVHPNASTKILNEVEKKFKTFRKQQFWRTLNQVFNPLAWLDSNPRMPHNFPQILYKNLLNQSICEFMDQHNLTAEDIKLTDKQIEGLKPIPYPKNTPKKYIPS